MGRPEGSVVRLGPYSYSFDDPAAVKAIYGIGADFPKSEFYEVFEGPRSGLGATFLFANRDKRSHADNRRQFSSIYAMSSVRGYEPSVDNCIELMCDKLLQRAQDGKSSIDMTKWFQWYAFDVISEVTVS